MEVNIHSMHNPKELESVIELLKKNDNPYIEYYKSIITSEKIPFELLVDLGNYGISHIRENEENFPLSDYFFLLSSLTVVPENMRDFFIDCMVYCEDGHIELSDTKTIHDTFSKITHPTT